MIASLRARNDPLHDCAYKSWTLRRAEILQSGRVDAIDVENIRAEIETLHS